MDRQGDSSVGSEEIREDIRQLTKRLADLEALSSGQSASRRKHGLSDDQLATIATSLYRLRQLRKKYFEASLLADPAWDMLLDLFIAAVRGARVATTSLCLAANVPQATGLRWIASLQQHGLVRRRNAVDDARLKLVELTPTGFRLMRGYLIDGSAALDGDDFRQAQLVLGSPGKSMAFR